MALFHWHKLMSKFGSEEKCRKKRVGNNKRYLALKEKFKPKNGKLGGRG